MPVTSRSGKSSRSRPSARSSLADWRKVGTSTPLVTGLRPGFPGGLAIAENGLNLLVATSDATTGKGQIERFTVSGTRAGNPASATIGTFNEPAGLHRAAQSDSYAYVDSGASGSGTVFVINRQ